MNYFDMNAYLRGEKTTQFVNAAPGMLYPGDPQFPSKNTNQIPKQWGKIAPRVGFTWDPAKDGKTVVRAAYGIFHEQQNGELNIAVAQGPPWAGKLLIERPVGGLDDPFRDIPGGNPFPFVLDKNAPYPPAGVFDTALPNTNTPYVEEWNLGLQKQGFSNWLLSASYIGNTAIHLDS